MLVFGRELQAMHNQLKAQYGHNEPNKKMLQVCVCCTFKHLLYQSCNTNYEIDKLQQCCN